MATAAGAAVQGRQGATSTRERALARRESAGKETRVPDKLFRPAPYCRAAPAGAAPAGATPAGAAPAGSAPSLLTHMPADALLGCSANLQVLKCPCGNYFDFTCDFASC